MGLMIICLGKEHKAREEDVGRTRRGLAEKPAYLICNLLSLTPHHHGGVMLKGRVLDFSTFLTVLESPLLGQGSTSSSSVFFSSILDITQALRSPLSSPLNQCRHNWQPLLTSLFQTLREAWSVSCHLVFQQTRTGWELAICYLSVPECMSPRGPRIVSQMVVMVKWDDRTETFQM